MGNTRFPSGWFILPSVLISVLIWIALASLAFGSTGGEAFSFTPLDFLKLHAANLITIAAAVAGVLIGLALMTGSQK